MAASDPVPCYFTGQNYRWEKPAQIKTRGEVRRLKNLKLGKFIDNGKIFLFFKSIVIAATEKIWDGPVGIGNLLPFAKRSSGDKLHYATPMAGDIGMRRHGLYVRCDEYGVRQIMSHEIRVSHRSLFSQQVLPQGHVSRSTQPVCA